MAAEPTPEEPTRWRHAAGGREPLAPSGEHRRHIDYTPRRQTGLGCVTSRPAGTAPPTNEERLAYALGITVLEVRRLLQEGKLP